MTEAEIQAEYEAALAHFWRVDAEYRAAGARLAEAAGAACRLQERKWAEEDAVIPSAPDL